MAHRAQDSSIWTCKLGAIGHQFKHNLRCSTSSHTHTHTQGPPTHMHTKVHKHTHTRPSVTSDTSASGPEKRWLDRWCNNVILWIRVINVGLIGWYLCLCCVKHTHTRWSITSWMSGITYDVYVTVIWKKSEKNEMGGMCFAFEVQSPFFCLNWDLAFRLVPFFSSPLFL